MQPGLSCHQVVSQKINIGTCGWSFDEWRGGFYPAHLAHNHWLEFYARHFSAIEVDSTFHHTPGANAVAHWFDSTPDDFCFSCKMPREITHELRLRDCEAKVEAFLEGIAPLQDKLGCILVQLPPHFSRRHDEAALRNFVMHLPRGLRFAIEFHDADWHRPRIAHLLEENQICWSWTDVSSLDQQNRAAFEFLPQTTSFLYLRLLGDLGLKYEASHGALLWPRDSSIESWAIKIKNHLAETSRIFIFVGNHFEGFAPLTARRIASQLGLQIQLPQIDESKTHEEAPDPQLNLL